MSCKIQNFNIYKNNIENGKIFTKEFQMDSRIEKFFKFNLIDISLEEANLIFYTNDKNDVDKSVSKFYISNISSNDYKSRLFIIEKNQIKGTNHIIYLSLLGESNSTKIQITLDYHDIKFFNSISRTETSLYIERLNCKNDFYIFESYFKKENNYNHLHTIPYYGDYNLVYYDKFNGNEISDLFKPYKEINITNKIKLILSNFNVFKLTCKTATLLKFKYLKENGVTDLREGREITTFIPRYTPNFKTELLTNDSNKKYKFYFGIFGENEIYNQTHITFYYHSIPFYLHTNSSRYGSDQKIDIFGGKVEDFGFQVYNIEVYLKLYLISNQYYTNVIEGFTKLTNETKGISFKLRRDIIYDYFIFRAYSHNRSLISLDYELKIVKPKDIENGKVLLAINRIKNYKKKEIIIKFSNPYDKFNSRIKKEDYVYFLASFISRVFPVYIDIRYYYNNSIITLEQSNPKILLSKKEYKIFGDENIKEKNQILLNIYKCNTRNYFMKTYYENNNNIISEEKIINNNTILFHDNIFNNTKFLLYSNDSYNNTLNNNSTSLKQASYYENGDLYMNYFSTNKTLYKSIKFTDDYKISYEDKSYKVFLKWNNYINNMDIINNLQVNYSIYILPINSPINSICQMSLIPPNISIINKNYYEKNLEKGEYKIAIIASVINKEFPIISLYDFSIIKVSIRMNTILIIVIGISIFILIIFLIICLCFNKKRKKDIIDEMRFSRQSRMISMANKFFGNDEDEQEIILNNDENENNIKNKKSENNDDNNSIL